MFVNRCASYRGRLLPYLRVWPSRLRVWPIAATTPSRIVWMPPSTWIPCCRTTTPPRMTPVRSTLLRSSLSVIIVIIIIISCQSPLLHRLQRPSPPPTQLHLLAYWPYLLHDATTCGKFARFLYLTSFFGV